MVVQHNLSAMNANRMLNVTTSAQSKSTEKLSSGYKINRAADDAAGLSISEKMRKQIKGLTKASSNAQDGVSAVQTAEGALTEVHSMLQRMNELAVQSSNGTNSQTDRKAIQDEIDQLTSEIDRVSETTKFNETYLLKGDATKTDTAYFMESKYNYADEIYVEGSKTKITSSDELAKAIKDGKKIYKKGYDQTNNEQTAANIAVKGVDYSYVTKLYDNNGKEVSAQNIQDSKNADGTAATNYYTSSAGAAGVAAPATNMEITAANAKNFTKGYEVNGSISFSLHVGADSAEDNKIVVNIDSMSAKGIGVYGLKVDTEDDATAAIDRIAEAIQKVSSQRSTLGAAQNRLEHTISNLDNVVENTTSAESRIRDTDMAQEMVNYSKNNILAQAGQSMLAQANQSNQGVLSLLQ
ncbi:MAG: flagellin [Lachnospira sp.]|nr:flagellin [Lachnospira sp.]